MARASISGDFGKLFREWAGPRNVAEAWADMIEAMNTYQRELTLSARGQPCDDIKKTVERLQGKYGKDYAQILKPLILAAVKGYELPCDFLGHNYMLLELGNKHTAQVFTPYNLAKICAQTVINDKLVKEALDEKGFITLHDPCIGGGAMAVACFDVLKNEYNLKPYEMVFIGNDIDRNCVNMASLAMLFSGISGFVTHADSLTLKKHGDTVASVHFLANNAIGYTSVPIRDYDQMACKLKLTEAKERKHDKQAQARPPHAQRTRGL